MKKIINFCKEYWLTILIFAGMIAAYKIIADNGLANAFLFPPVEGIIQSFEENKGTMFMNMLHSMGLLAPSIIISLIIALLLGVIIGMHKKLRKMLHPVIYTFSVVPAILLSPFVLLMTPNFWWAALILIVYGTMWATLFATITGIMTIDKRYLDNAATLELHGFKRLYKIILPAASPSILSGFVNSLRSSFVMLVYAEMYGAKYGMGFFVRKYSEFGLYRHTWSGFIFMVVVLLIVMQIFERMKDHMLRWTIH